MKPHLGWGFTEVDAHGRASTLRQVAASLDLDRALLLLAIYLGGSGGHWANQPGEECWGDAGIQLCRAHMADTLKACRLVQAQR
jgi:hypothetical protein